MGKISVNDVGMIMMSCIISAYRQYEVHP